MLRTSRLIIPAAIALSLGPALLAQAPGTVAGRVYDHASGQPIADARVAFRLAADSSGSDRPSTETYTDREGRFRIAAEPGRRYIVSVWHLGYGLHQNALLIPPAGHTTLEISLSETAIRLAPVTVETTPAESADRSSRAPGVASREEIAEAARSGLSLLDFLTRRFSGLYLQRSGQIGAAPCIQFRLARVAGMCRPPLVRLDRTTITGNNTLEFLASFPLAQLQRIEVVPLSAGSEGGQGLEGTILLETEGGPRTLELAGASRKGEIDFSYDWERRENGGYPWARVYAASFLGNAAGLAAGLAILGQCADLARYRPRYNPGDGRYFDGTTWHSRPDIRCSPGLWLVTGVSAVALPALGGSLAGRLAGATNQSNGLMSYSAVASQAVFIPAMALIITTDHPDGPLTLAEVTAFALATVGAPLLNTLADRFLRVLR